ncbi:hypothetical protein PanWU01x14_075290 [Parasponia andersonii]|uniref:Uncharacterized protein n=1 Tax=Parasponia andersonii TaxID=3476 RepID=A0A2P5DCV8_PARAD|nr:hypothetical protein PanWU01x14_075290 [Parasponia andersonii]
MNERSSLPQLKFLGTVFPQYWICLMQWLTAQARKLRACTCLPAGSAPPCTQLDSAPLFAIDIATTSTASIPANDRTRALILVFN